MYLQTREMPLVFPPFYGVNSTMDQSAAKQMHTDIPDFSGLLGLVAQSKDRQAFAQLFEYFAPRIKSFLMKGGAAPDAADELAQETMVTVWQKAASFDPVKASASTWIFTIARNKRIDALRRKVRPEVDADDPLLQIADDAPSAAETLAAQEDTQVMGQAIQTLPPEQAQLLYKSFFEDKTHADIAKETGIALGTVKSRIRLALERLSKDKKVKDLWQ